MRKLLMKKYSYIICLFCIVAIFTAMYYVETRKNVSDSGYAEQESGVISGAEEIGGINDGEDMRPAANDEDVTAINYEDISFIIKSVDNDIVVYYDDGETVFLDTGMSPEDFGYHDLVIPEEGIIVENAEELFDLLETYSS